MKSPFIEDEERQGAPPATEILTISLSLLAAMLGTPFLFKFAGPLISKLVFEAYGSHTLAEVMYYATYVLSGAVIYAIARMTLWYALGAVVAFGALRVAGFAAV